MVRLLIAGLILWPVLGLVAGQAGAATDFQDIPYMQSRINQVLEREPTGTEVEWRNQATGNAGVIRVLRTYFPSPGAPCRDYERTTRRPDGTESTERRSRPPDIGVLVVAIDRLLHDDPYFKAGVCEKGKKCKFSHDITIEDQRTLAIDLYSDPRTKTGKVPVDTIITCRDFLAAGLPETQLFFDAFEYAPPIEGDSVKA